MVKNVLALVLRNNKVLAFKKTEDGTVRLPYFPITEEDSLEEVLDKNILSKLGSTEFDTIKLEKSLFTYDRASANKEFKICLIDIKDEELNELTEEESNLTWMDSCDISMLSQFEKVAIRNLLEKCIKDKYSSFSILMLEGEVNKREADAIYIDRLKAQIEEKEVDQNVSPRSIFIAIIFAIIVGISYYNFFFHYMGVAALIYTSIIIIYFVAVNGIKNQSNILGYFFMFCSLILSLTFSIYTNTALRALNSIIIPITLTISFLILNYKDLKVDLLNLTNAFFKRIFPRSFKCFVKPPVFIVNSIKNKKVREQNSSYKHIRNGLLISIPVVFILCLILSEADNVFGYYIRNLKDMLANLDFLNLSWNTLCSIFVAFYVFGFIWSFKYSFRDNIRNEWKRVSLEPITTMTVLVVVNILYFVFTMVQITYLYGGNLKALPGGLTYAEYARKGFFELSFVAVMNVLAIGFLKLRVVKKTDSFSLVLNLLYTIMTGFTLNMVVSAFYKMRLYINAFGYTRLRILVEFFIVFLGLVLILQLAFVWKDLRVSKPIIILAMVMYIFINFFNIDSYIARNNIALTKEGNLDAFYLSNLSFDAFDEMKKAAEEGAISAKDYGYWKDINYKDTKHWHEYNYYLKKGMGK